jgi:hypothetical protein
MIGAVTPGRNEWLIIHKSLLAGTIPSDIPFLTAQSEVYSAHLQTRPARKPSPVNDMGANGALTC